MKNVLYFLATAALMLQGCSEYSNPASSKKSEVQPTAFVGSPPTSPESERAQLSRYLGQEQFLNPAPEYFFDGADRAVESEAANKGQRAEQESDVYKLGKAGTKLLFLLNNYRGLQVISYENGPERPEIIGRVHSTGRFSSDMYYDEASDRIIVLEYNWRGKGENKSRIVVYDVSQPDAPKITETVGVRGRYVDSRIVGSVLYIASRTDDKGVVTSYDLTRTYTPKIAERELRTQLTYQQNMNIVEVPTDEGYKYYLVAALSESGWGWWGRNSIIEVVDISDEAGRIRPVMSVSAKGFVRERSQTTIKDDTLIVTSNYLIEGSEPRLARIAVETFKMPTEESEVLTEDEAQYRKLAIERQLQGLSGEAKEEKRDELLKDSELGLIGRFVKNDDTVRKLFSDSVVTVGDTQGLSAQLQDVRYSGDLLYAFWVPANLVDPFDLFDMSEPREGIKYLGRLQFDGWIERAIPMDVGDRKFVLGLGWEVPNVNNETGRRAPQAMLFEIIDSHGQLRALDVAKLSLTDSNIYTNFNAQDKMIEVRYTEEGKGQVLFAASRFGDGSYDSGGQVINFDIPALLAGDREKTLTKGAFLAGNSGWIRRMFTNDLIDRVSSFSDRMLATYSAGAMGVGNDLSPAHILELARNIRAYETLGTTVDSAVGVQLISDYSWYSSEAAQTVLRTVPARKADTEKPAVLAEMSVTGSYLGHLVEKGTKNLIILTNSYEKFEVEEGAFSYKTINYAYRVKVSEQGQVELLGKTSWSFSRTQDIMPIGLRSSIMPPYYYGRGTTSTLVQLENGQILAQADSGLKWLETGSGLEAKDVQTNSCELDNRTNVQLQIVQGKAYLTSSEVLESREYPGLRFSRNFVSEVAAEQSTLNCLADINVPGTLLSRDDLGRLLLQDTWAKDIVEQEYTRIGDDEPGKYFRAITENSLTLVSTREEQKATLIDERPDSSRYGQRMALANGSVIQIKSSDNSGYRNQGRTQLESISISESGRILEDLRELNTKFEEQASLLAVASSPESNESYLVLGAGSQVQVIRWNQEEQRQQTEKLVALDVQMDPLAPEEVIELPGENMYGTTVNFTPELKSFEISRGLFGITQFFIAD